MQLELNRVKQYLSGLNIDVDQKRYAMNFCKKMQYLDELRSIAIQDTGQYVCSGYGNVNSQICFVFTNKQAYEIIKSIITEVLEKFHLNIWNVYITFVDKTDNEYSKKYSLLVNEIHAVGANLVFVIDKNEDIYNRIIETFNTRNIALPQKHFFVDVHKLASTEPEDRKVLWNSFKYLINYKEIEQEE